MEMENKRTSFTSYGHTAAEDAEVGGGPESRQRTQAGVLRRGDPAGSAAEEGCGEA